MTQILTNSADIGRFRQLQQGKTLALVPTMGNLHEGHLSLVRLAIEMPKSLTTILCGINRPTHFQGVATVVAKLFQLIHPDMAVFGEKDFQQLAIIRRLNEELFMNIKLFGGETVREPDGLAMSSRNQYLNPEERQQAAGLFKVLQSARARLLAGEALTTVLSDSKALLTQQGFTVDYLDCRDSISLAESTNIAQAVLLVAARIGSTRLIDNLRITPL